MKINQGFAQNISAKAITVLFLNRQLKQAAIENYPLITPIMTND
jgi:hypothetical protein